MIGSKEGTDRRGHLELYVTGETLIERMLTEGGKDKSDVPGLFYRFMLGKIR